MTTADFVTRLAIATLAGLIIGFERQWHQKSAGLRTNGLVATGSAIYVLLSISITNAGTGDVTRIIGQVVSGIGFLGAGIIFKEGLNVHGLSTAATIWCSAAIGCLAGAGFFTETLISTLAVLIVNWVLHPVDLWLDRRSKNNS
jgi:putative Mg2+ transporter-C (MgtC) family protein